MTTLNETYVNSFKINRLTKTQLNNATSLDPTQEYHVDPEFTGNKILSTDANGDIVETSVTNTELGYLSGTTSAVQTQLNGKASTSLDNLSANGQMIIDSQNGTISNCILEIPQDIKLELNNGTLTLKSGSKIYVPNGSSGCDLVETANDITYSYAGNGKWFVFLSINRTGISIREVNKVFSGDTEPTGISSNGVWYDTANNYVKRTDNGGSTWTSGMSLPIALMTVSGGVITSIDQVFNGFGYIGSVSYYLPDIKILFADGINTDGTLKSIKYTTDRVMVSSSTYECPYVIQYSDRRLNPANSKNYAEQEEQPSFTNGLWYQPSTNTMFNISNSVVTKTNKIRVFNQTVSSGQITSMTNVRQPVRLATTEMLDTELSKKQDVLTFDTTPTQNSTNPVTSGGIYNKIFSSADVVHRDTVLQTTGYDLLTQPLNSIHNLEGTGAINSPQGDSTVSNAGMSLKIGRTDSLTDWCRAFYLYGKWTNSKDLWYGTRAVGTSENPATTINWHPVVIADKENTFTGIQNFRKTSYSRGDLLRLYDDGQVKGTNPTSTQGSVINWSDKNGSALGLIENRYETDGRRYLHFNTRNGDCTVSRNLDFGWVSSNNGYKLTIGTNESINYSLNEISTSTTDCDVPTKGYINQKFTVVSTVPVSPTTGVYYFVTTGQIYYGSTLVMDANLTNYTGYDATKTQTLKNVNGTLTWVDD